MIGSIDRFADIDVYLELEEIERLSKEKIDVLHCQGFLSSFLGLCLSGLIRIPYIVTVQRLEGKGNPLKNFVYRKASVCIGASRAVAENFRKIGVKNIEVIPNGIDLNEFNPQVPPIRKFSTSNGASAKLNILFLGRIEERKSGAQRKI